jgi:hypothetical protein
MTAKYWCTECQRWTDHATVDHEAASTGLPGLAMTLLMLAPFALFAGLIVWGYLEIVLSR